MTPPRAMPMTASTSCSNTVALSLGVGVLLLRRLGTLRLSGGGRLPHQEQPRRSRGDIASLAINEVKDWIEIVGYLRIVDRCVVQC